METVTNDVRESIEMELNARVRNLIYTKNWNLVWNTVRFVINTNTNTHFIHKDQLEAFTYEILSK